MGRYYWNFDETSEFWYCSENTIEECVEQAKKEAEEYKYDLGIGDDAVVYIGEIEKFVPCIDGDSILDQITDTAYGEHREAAEGWLEKVKSDTVDELSDDLTNALVKWLDKHGLLPEFGSIENVKAYDLKTGKEVKEE